MAVQVRTRDTPPLLHRLGPLVHAQIRKYLEGRQAVPIAPIRVLGPHVRVRGRAMKRRVP
eukprot:6951941-Heterocapsa_arctica.AAC.1